jgi:tetratricopeptide (TPR) repeat protein
MNAKRLALYASLALAGQGAMAQQATILAPLAGKCAELFHAGVSQLDNGGLREAEITLGAALAGATGGEERECAGLALGKLALVANLSGRPAEAETLAERALRILENIYPQDDLVLLRPLQQLTLARFGRGETAKALQALQRLKSIRAEKPGDRAIVCGTAAVILQAAGRLKDAELEYLSALKAWDDSGHSESADVGATLTSLGTLYLTEGRLGKAQVTLTRAFTIVSSARGSVPRDLIMLLSLRGVLYGRQKDWGKSEADLRSALSLADREPGFDRAALRSILSNLAYVLRKNRQGREAHAIQARAESLGTSGTNGLVVDIGEMRSGGRLR